MSACYISYNVVRDSFTFYPRDAMLARVFAIATCLSGRLSVRLSGRPSHAGIVAERRQDSEITPSDSPITLVSGKV